MDVSAPTAQSLWRFFWLIFALSVPLWGIGAVINGLLPRETPVFTALNLAWHISLALTPMAAALILVRQERRPDGVKTLLRRPFDYARIRHKAWYFVIFEKIGNCSVSWNPPSPRVPDPVSGVMHTTGDCAQ